MQGLVSNSDWRAFWTVWFGQGFSKMGGPFQLIAVNLWVLAAGHGPIMMAFITAAGLGGQALGTVFGGAIGDRHGPLVVMAACDFLRMLSSAAIASVVFFGLSVVLCVPLMAFSGVLTGIFTPALQNVTPEVLQREDYVKGNGVFQAVNSSGELLGALFGGISLSLIGAHKTIALNAASFGLGAIFAAIAARRCSKRGLRRHRANDSDGLFRSSLNGFRYAVSRQWLLVVIAMSFVIDTVTAGQLRVGLPIMAAREGGGAAMGVMLAGFAAGMIVGATLLARVRSPTVHSLRFVVGVDIVQAPFFAIIPLLNPGWIASDLFICGVMNGCCGVVFMSILHRSVAPEYQSRVMSVFLASGLIAQPFGTLVLGWLAEGGYLSKSFFVGAMIMFCVSLWGFMSPAVKRYDMDRRTENVHVRSATGSTG